MFKITIKNWKQFQHYNKRNPPWIRLYRSLIDDYEFACLPDASRALAPMLWLLASEYPDGEITASRAAIAFRLHISEAKLESALKPLIDGGFIIDASNLLAGCYPNASLETERETERDSVVTEDVTTADVPVGEDPRARLFREGKTILTSFGTRDNRQGGLLGMWLKQCADDCVGLLALLKYARDQSVADPVAYISATLSSKDKSNGRQRLSVVERANALADEIEQRELAAGIHGARHAV
jgi:hypothetical protein